MEVASHSTTNNPMSQGFFGFPDGFGRPSDHPDGYPTLYDPPLSDAFTGLPHQTSSGLLQLPSSAMQLFRKESGGLSLSLTPNLPRLDGELEVRDGVLCFNHPGQDLTAVAGMSVAQLLRQSKYARPTQELLLELCCVGRGELNYKCGKRQGSSSSNPNPNSPTALPPPDRLEQQRKKTKLLSMLDEVDRRYGRYCEQIQALVNSFDCVMGFGAAAPYTTLARKAMSRHFRCLKEAVVAQLKRTCELLGEKDNQLISGFTKGETPRLKLLDRSLRQQRAFHHVGAMDNTETWRPQRGLPERSVGVLRAWLFEHFLHPYPSDTDKHLLARQTGLSRNQVSNWFINARVRLWKPMIEEMYNQEAREEEEERRDSSEPSDRGPRSPTKPQSQGAPNGSVSGTAAHDLMTGIRQFPHQGFVVAAAATTSSSSLHNPHLFPAYQASNNTSNNDDTSLVGLDLAGTAELCGFEMSAPDHFGITFVDPNPDHIRFGATGDVSLTLGLKHPGNAPENGRFSFRNFGGL